MKAKEYIDQIIKLTKVISYACLISEDADTSREATSERAEVIKELLKLCENTKTISIQLNSAQVCRLINIAANKVKVLSIRSIGPYDFAIEVEGSQKELYELLFQLGINPHKHQELNI